MNLERVKDTWQQDGVVVGFNETWTLPQEETWYRVNGRGYATPIFTYPVNLLWGHYPVSRGSGWELPVVECNLDDGSVELLPVMSCEAEVEQWVTLREREKITPLSFPFPELPGYVSTYRVYDPVKDTVCIEARSPLHIARRVRIGPIYSGESWEHHGRRDRPAIRAAVRDHYG
jgi:hypothetical protein